MVLKDKEKIIMKGTTHVWGFWEACNALRVK